MRKANKKSAPRPNSRQNAPVFKCSFCAKTEDSVIKLICGPGAFICNECVQLSNDILLTEIKSARPSITTTKSKSRVSGNGHSSKAFRERMFELIVDEAIDNALWKDSCKAAMTLNKITPGQVDAEVQKRLKSARSSLHQLQADYPLRAQQRAFLVLNHISDELSNIKTRLATMEKRLRNGR